MIAKVISAGVAEPLAAARAMASPAPTSGTNADADNRAEVKKSRKRAQDSRRSEPQELEPGHQRLYRRRRKSRANLGNTFSVAPGLI